MLELNHQPSYGGDNIEDMLAGGADIDDLIADGYLDDGDDLSPAEKAEHIKNQKAYARSWGTKVLTNGCDVVF